MYSIKSNLIIAFHGCDESVRDKVVSGKDILHPSTNNYDWLGHGIYFWENNESRAFQYANDIMKNPGRCKSIINKPSVIGAIISLGHCFDLIDSEYLSMLKISYKYFQIMSKSVMPINHGGTNLLIRNLDCAVIESFHQFNKDHKIDDFDSVRGVFWEGKDLYPNAGFKEKNHIQICIRNPNCIKGFFIPRTLDTTHKKV